MNLRANSPEGGGEPTVRSYEIMLIIRPELEEEAVQAVIDRVTKIITSANGEVTNVDQWGKRKLAYEIKDNTEGFYVVIDFNADNEATTEVERVLRITDEVLRFLLVRKEQE